MRTRSPSMIARGVTATSGRQSRSFEGAIEIHQTTTAKNKTRKAAVMPRRGDTQQAQTANAAKAAANANRSSAQGSFEYQIASVPQAMSTTCQPTQRARMSQPRDLAKKLRSDLTGLLFDSIEASDPGIARAICREFTQVTMTDHTPSYAASAHASTGRYSLE